MRLRAPLLAALVCLATGPARADQRAAGPKISAVPQVISLLQASLQASPPAAAIPALDPAKAEAFLNRAQAVEEAASAHPLAVPSLPASAVEQGAAASAAPQVPAEAREVVLGAVSAALDGLSSEDIERLPAEDVARLSRRIFDEVSGTAARPTALSRDVLGRLKGLSSQARARMGRYLGQAYDLLAGHGGGPVGKGASTIPAIQCLRREPQDRMPPEPAPRKGALAHEIMRLLDDSDGPDGFNHFVMTVALDAYIEAESAGRLRGGERKVTLVDPRDGKTPYELTVKDLPVIPEQDLEAILDRRLRAYGLDARRLGLEGRDVPAGRFVDAFQHLYLADRLSNAELNGFRGDVLPAFLTSREPLESARRAMPARRSPCNPTHVRNLLRLLFEIP